MSNTIIENTEHLLAYIISQADSGTKAWFNYPQQRIVGIYMCYELAKAHANTMTPEEVIEYVVKMNNLIYHKIVISGDKNG
ncbi:hypothetical protein UFOVP11_25 [uncultured Caudovirales phage]|uniref:Uncharacterized protein n=1 Tax=uncultured Caudovirales phage TaxID=2100421 RepID=A0A6J5KJX2_9CAUD|nr:hypothetical protein UFOVP11_25 [uncultured Caudovirales phage]